MEFKYVLSGGCGRTKLELCLNIDYTFHIDFDYNWMGRPLLKLYFDGIYQNNGNNYYLLMVNDIYNDNVHYNPNKLFNLEFVTLTTTQEIFMDNFCDINVKCLIMANDGFFNNKKSTFDALLCCNLNHKDYTNNLIIKELLGEHKMKDVIKIFQSSKFVKVNKK